MVAKSLDDFSLYALPCCAEGPVECMLIGTYFDH